MTNDDALVEAMARAIEHQHDYGDECLEWREQIECGGGYKFTRIAMLSLARSALAAYRQRADGTRAAFERESG